ncbi:uncharacterized protein LOC108107177 [Drosophila eugracilis]|uniref:uncharacterized protein LOC108107177 n=1 Tax=Drosophila eugracilis TaxID=29029 RepID=UPI001BD9F664|nr:uncharacterized protein LOC108107177 [Drosophila eugracilis]
MEPELSPRYSPKLRNYGDHLSHSTRKQERQEEKGGEDFILYKNLTFGEPPSSKSEHGGDDGNKQKTTFQSNHQNHKKDSKNYLEAAKAQCHAAGERFQRQLVHSSESSSSKNTKSKLSKVTVISAKSGDDLRAAVRLQIEEQEALHKLSMMEKRRKEEVEPDGKNINQKLDPKPEDVLKPHLNSDDLQHIDCSISSDDLVCTKVIEPMMRKIQRMYLYTLKEEMSLMDYLGTVPKLVRDIYKQEPAEKDEKKI